MRGIRIVAYLIFCCLVIEGSSRLAYKILPLARYLNVDDDASWRRDWVRRHKQSGAEIVYKFDVYDSTKGWKAKPNFHGVGPSGETLNTNSRGFRGVEEFPLSKTPPRKRIVVLGDSFIFGDEVSDSQTIVHDLQEIFPGTDIINLGVHGYGQDQMLILLREEGIRYHPDVVIIGFLGDDMTRNVLSFRDFAKPRFELDGSRPRLTNSPVPTPQAVLAGDWKRPRFFDLLSALTYRIRVATGSYNQHMTALSGAIIGDMVRVADSVSAVPLLVYLPIPSDAFASAATADERFMFSICASNPKARCFSARPSFSTAMTKAPEFKLGGHLNPAGQQAVAAGIAEYLVQSGLIDEAVAAPPFQAAPADRR